MQIGTYTLGVGGAAHPGCAGELTNVGLWAISPKPSLQHWENPNAHGRSR